MWGTLPPQVLPRAIILPEETLLESFSYLLNAMELGPQQLPHPRLSAPTRRGSDCKWLSRAIDFSSWTIDEQCSRVSDLRRLGRATVGQKCAQDKPLAEWVIACVVF